MTRFFFAIPLVLIASAASAQQQPGHDACARDVSRFCRALMQSGDNAVLGCLQTTAPGSARPARKCWPITASNYVLLPAAVATTGNTSFAARSGLSSCQRTDRTDAPACGAPELDRVRDGTRSPFDAARVRTWSRGCAGAESRARSAMHSARSTIRVGDVACDRPAIAPLRWRLSCTSCMHIVKGAGIFLRDAIFDLDH